MVRKPDSNPESSNAYGLCLIFKCNEVVRFADNCVLFLATVVTRNTTLASILLVEDDTDLAFAIKLWFERKGYAIQNVTTGAEAFECIRFDQFDLIILDGHLPDMTGVEICTQYRTNGGTSPVLMLSGLSNDAEIAAGLAAGANEYLAKPFVMTELAKRIDALLLPVSS